MASTGELRRFETDLQASEELRAKLDEAIRRLAEAGTGANNGELVAAAAAELGYEISVADFERNAAEGEELDEAELEAISGGWKDGDDEYGHSGACMVTWHCETVLLHTDCEAKDGIACWSNYECLAINENPELCGWLPNSK